MIKFFNHFFVFVLMFFALQGETQSIKEFFIECNMDEFEYMYENYYDEIYVPIILTYNGHSWSDVRIRIRGDSSRDYPKKSLKVLFDNELFIDGKDRLNFNAEYFDKSYLHSVLSSRIFKDAGVDCVAMEHIRLYLNGSFYGLYVLTENLDQNFLEDAEFNSLGNLYKAKVDGACLSEYDNIYYHWDKKLDSSPDRGDLEDLIFNLNNINDDEFLEFLSNNFNYSKLTNFIALNMLLANGSTYYHNYFMYNDQYGTGKWYIFPWDLDRTLAAYSQWYEYQRSSGFWTPDNPLLERSLIIDEVFFDIASRIQVLKNSVFNKDYLFPIIDSLKAVIEVSVLEDESDDVPDFTTWIEHINNNKTFIENRYDLLMNQIYHYPYNFQVNRLSDYFLPGEEIEFSWNAAIDPDGDDVSYTLYYGKNMALNDTSTIVIEGINEASYIIDGLTEVGKYYFKVEATDGENTITGFDSYNPFYISEEIPLLVINEINYNSSNEFDSDDWVEIYNPGETAVDLTGWYFMDEDDQHKFIFSSGSSVDSDGYIVLCTDISKFYTVFPDTIQTFGDMSFGLKNSGELIRLFHPTGYLVDFLVYDDDSPWPTAPDGGGSSLELRNPSLNNEFGYNWDGSINHGTPGEQNSNYNFSKEMTSSLLVLHQNYPNPFQDHTNITYELESPSDIKLRIFDLYGCLVFEKDFLNQSKGEHTYRWVTNIYSSGIYHYIILVGDQIIGSRIGVKL